MSGTIEFGDTDKIITSIYERRKGWNWSFWTQNFFHKPRVDSLVATTVLNYESILLAFNIKYYEGIEGLQLIKIIE